LSAAINGCKTAATVAFFLARLFGKGVVCAGEPAYRWPTDPPLYQSLRIIH
jgi:hypothetical protein